MSEGAKPGEAAAAGAGAAGGTQAAAAGGPEPDRFLSGTLGSPGGRLGRLARRLADGALDLRLARAASDLDALGAAAPEQDILVLSVYRGDGGLLPNALAELRDTRHRVRFALASMDAAAEALAEQTVATGLSGGKFANLNAAFEELRKGSDPAARPHSDWVLVVDDDVVLPRRFLDRIVGIAEELDFAMAQPAQSLASHAAWPVTRRRRGSLVRESRFVEIGPVTLFRRDAFDELTPFPELRYGWGLDLHWAAVAEQRGWRLGIVDALPVRHEQARVAGTYSSEDAIAEARSFLAERPFLDSTAAQESRRVR